MYQLKYGSLTKYWTTFPTMAVAIPIIILGFAYMSPSDIENPYALLFVLVPIAYNLHVDLKNYSNLSNYQVSNEGVYFGSELTPWSSIDSFERFGPTVRNSRQGQEIKLFYASGVFIKVEGKEYILYASAKNYKQFIEQLSSNGVHCENA